MTWNSEAFHVWYRGLTDSNKKLKAWRVLTSANRKSYQEWLAFKRFAAVSPLDIDPRSIQNRNPNEPDIQCFIAGAPHYFELGEVTDQNLAEQAGIAAGLKLESYGGAVSPTESLSKMIDLKCMKTYTTGGIPTSLLLHFAVGHQHPHTEKIVDLIARSRQTIASTLRVSPFDIVWLYDGWSNRIIDSVER